MATLPCSSDSHRFLLVMVDMLAKFVDTYPMVDQQASSVV